MLWFEITKMVIALQKNKFIVSFITIFGTFSFPIDILVLVPFSRPHTASY